MSQPTCVAFGGENKDLLFITSAKEWLDKQALEKEPKAGHVFVYQMNISGLPEPKFITNEKSQ